jgi:hypothetical protein
VEDLEDLELNPETREVARVVKPLIRKLVEVVEIAFTAQGGE